MASSTHDRQHADKVLEEYVTTTVTDVMSNFFGSQFSEQSTAVKVLIHCCIISVLLAIRIAEQSAIGMEHSSLPSVGPQM